MWYCTMLQAQQVVATAGSTHSNSNGSMSFTIGEGVANTLTKGDKALTQGFQQASITVSIVSEPKDLDFSISAYPNPTTDVLTLLIGKENVSGFQYLLYDINGKLLIQKNLEASEIAVHLGQLKAGSYFIKIQDGLKELKTFKIIKQ